MDKRYACYCGLYCENCAIKQKVFPAAKVLYKEMKMAGFDKPVNSIPGGEGFWSFLKMIAENWECTSCREGSGNPDCVVRKCAQEKGVEMCALCESYPCEIIDSFDEGYPVLKDDNALLRDKGWDAWAELQDERRKNGFTYTDNER
jgi:hypothetical protein